MEAAETVFRVLSAVKTTQVNMSTNRREKMKAVVAEIAEHFGYEQQKNMLIEEQAELIQALNKFDRKRTEEAFNNIIEEIADVELMIDQVKYLLDISQDAIEEIKEDKIRRTKERIKREENEQHTDF